MNCVCQLYRCTPSTIWVGQTKMSVDSILDADMIMLNGNSFGHVLFVLYMLPDNRFNLEWLW